jgi:hypothetical protein
MVAYVLGHSSALCNVAASGVSQILAPDEVLSAVEASPVPVHPHHGANEVGVVGVRSVIVVEVAWLDIVRWSGDCGSREEGSESCERLHVCLTMAFTGRNDQGVLMWVSQRLGCR